MMRLRTRATALAVALGAVMATTGTTPGEIIHTPTVAQAITVDYTRITTGAYSYGGIFKSKGYIVHDFVVVDALDDDRNCVYVDTDVYYLTGSTYSPTGTTWIQHKSATSFACTGQARHYTLRFSPTWQSDTYLVVTRVCRDRNWPFPNNCSEPYVERVNF